MKGPMKLRRETRQTVNIRSHYWRAFAHWSLFISVIIDYLLSLCSVLNYVIIRARSLEITTQFRQLEFPNFRRVQSSCNSLHICGTWREKVPIWSISEIEFTRKSFTPWSVNHARNGDSCVSLKRSRRKQLLHGARLHVADLWLGCGIVAKNKDCPTESIPTPTERWRAASAPEGGRRLSRTRSLSSPLLPLPSFSHARAGFNLNPRTGFGRFGVVAIDNCISGRHRRVPPRSVRSRDPNCGATWVAAIDF